VAALAPGFPAPARTAGFIRSAWAAQACAACSAAVIRSTSFAWAASDREFGLQGRRFGRSLCMIQHQASVFALVASERQLYAFDPLAQSIDLEHVAPALFGGLIDLRLSAYPSGLTDFLRLQQGGNLLLVRCVKRP
jgi:hypothetical protein